VTPTFKRFCDFFFQYTAKTMQQQQHYPQQQPTSSPQQQQQHQQQSISVGPALAHTDNVSSPFSILPPPHHRCWRINTITTSDHLTFLTDSLSSRRFLIDSSSSKSVIPYYSSLPTTGPTLYTADDKPIATWGFRRLAVKFGDSPSSIFHSFSPPFQRGHPVSSNTYVCITLCFNSLQDYWSILLKFF
jgi:hypothetical protein